MTNNDKINEMGAWQKAEFFERFDCTDCPIDHICDTLREEDIPKAIVHKGKCFNAWYKWLNMEVRE